MKTTLETNTHKIEGINNSTLAPVVTVSDITIPEAELNRGIYWLNKGDQFTVSANCDLPDGSLMLIIEKVTDASNVVDDTRFKADILDGKLTMTGVFEDTGNWLLTAERSNKGLNRIQAGFNLSFESIEFDIYT